MAEAVSALPDVRLRDLRPEEVDAADTLFRVAFGTHIGLPRPEAFMGDAQLVRFRWRMDPGAFLAAEVDGDLVGINYVTNWGRFGYFGPLAVRPDFWDRGIARRLLEATMQRFEALGTEHAALFTFPDSAKHLWLYQKFGFSPRYLTAVMTRELVAASRSSRYSLLSTQPPARRASLVDATLEVTNSVYQGLDLRMEVESLLAQDAGDVVLVDDGERLQAFAVCHYKAGSEAEAGSLYVKFGAVRPGFRSNVWLSALLEACADLALKSGKRQLVAGVSTEREQAYRALLAEGFRPGLLGIAMHRPNKAGYNRPDVLVIEDLR